MNVIERQQTVNDGCIGLLSILPVGLTISNTKNYLSNIIETCSILPQKFDFIKRVQDCVSGCENSKEENCQFCSCFDVYDLFIGEIDRKKVLRLYLGTTYASWNKKKLRIDIFIKILAEKNIGIIDFNIAINNLTVEEIIELRHAVDNTTLISKEEWSSCFCQTDEIENLCTLKGGALFSFFNHITEIIMRYLSKKINKLTKKNKDTLSDEIAFYKPIYNLQTILELRSIGDFATTDKDAHEWVLEHSQAMYGLLTGDEGIGFIPNELTHKRLSSHWTSRRFFDVLAFGKNVLVVNSKTTGKLGHEYMCFQEKLNTKYTSDENRIKYFKGKPCMAGLDHGVLQAIERNMVIRYYYDFIDKQTRIDGKKLNNQRQKLLSFIASSSSPIDEINDLFETISEASGTSKSISLVRNKLNIQSEEMNIDYQNKNNGIILFLTIFSLIISICALQRDTIVFGYLPNYSKVLGIIGTIMVIIASLIVIVIMCIRYFKK